MSKIYVYGIAAFSVFIALLGLFKNYKIARWRAFFFGQFFFCLGIVLHALYNFKEFPPQFTGKQEIVFTIDEKLNSSEKNRKYQIQFSHGDAYYGSVLYVPKNFPELDFKHFYKTTVYINQIEAPQFSYQFDYAKYMERQGVHYQSYLSDKLEESSKRSLSIANWVKQNRFDLLQKINQSSLSERNREFLKGIILADRTEMSQETVQDFTKTGLMHLLAISGSHIVVIFAIFYAIFGFIFQGSRRNLSIYLSLFLIWLFAIYIGLGNSVVRACLMLTFYYAYQILQRKKDTLHSLALAALFILLFDTRQLFDVGFQLSFLAVFGIYWLNKPILKYFPKPKTNWQRQILNIASLTFAAQIATMPLVLYYFHQFSWISFVANLIIIPLAEIVIVSSLFMVLFIGTGSKVLIIEKIYNEMVNFVLDLIHWFAGFEDFFSKNISFSLTEAILLFISILLLRPVLQNFNFKSVMRFGFAFSAFFLLKFALDYYYQMQNEIITHRYFKKPILSIKEDSTVKFYVSENLEQEKIERFIAEPYAVSVRAKEISYEKLPPGTQKIIWKDKVYELK